jgi:hypothetical protein
MARDEGYLIRRGYEQPDGLRCMGFYEAASGGLTASLPCRRVAVHGVLCCACARRAEKQPVHPVITGRGG